MKLENLKVGQKVLVEANIIEVDEREGEKLNVKISFDNTINDAWINHNSVAKIIPHEFETGDLVRYHDDKVIVVKNDGSEEFSIRILYEDGVTDWVDPDELEFIKKGALNWE